MALSLTPLCDITQQEADVEDAGAEKAAKPKAAAKAKAKKVGLDVVQGVGAMGRRHVAPPRAT